MNCKVKTPAHHCGKIKEVKTDFTVVGGGIAGCLAAIAAARLGLKVALINDRPILGGNSSSEIRVWICGATGGRNNRYSRETGIMDQLLTENKFKNPEGNPHIWDLILLDHVIQEPNISLYLNTVALHVEKAPNSQEISAVIGRQSGTEEFYRFQSPLFLDSSGDGIIGYLSGAHYMMGREGRDEFQESLAPETSDNKTLGSTILFYVKDQGKPVKFIPPSFAYDISTMEELLSKRPGYKLSPDKWGCHYWWFEFGGILNTIKDNENIAWELRRFVYGAWNYIKNSGKFQAENLTLEWVGNIPGKRESRRFIGDYILTQNDIAQQRRFPDAVCYGGWSIDTHPPEGFRSPEPGCFQLHPNGPYDIPLRCLYSKNISNLFFAGRNISATHLAFASTRVMATCGLMGQAVGTTAFICNKYHVEPKDVYPHHMGEIQELLLKNDSYIIGMKTNSKDNITRDSKIHASSYERAKFNRSRGRMDLTKDRYLLLPAALGQIDTLSVLLDASQATHIKVQVYETDKPENYLLGKLLSETSCKVNPGESQWVHLNLNYKGQKRVIFVRFLANEAIHLHSCQEKRVGIMTLERVDTSVSPSGGEIAGYHFKTIDNICFKTNPEQGAYRPENVGNGYLRPFGLPNLWISEDMGPHGECLSFDFPKPTPIREITLYFNADLDKPLNNLMPSYLNVFPETVRDYSIYSRSGDSLHKLLDVQGNYQRFRRHRLDTPVEADGLKILFKATNGDPKVQVFQVNIYRE